MRDFRFGCTIDSPGSQRELADTLRSLDAYGYDIAFAVDHLGPGRSSPFPTVVAAALTDARLRVGTLVLNIGYWNPAILARDVATAVRLTDRRFELGLGSGIVKAQYDAAGIPWQPFNERMDRITATLDEVGELLSAEDDVARPPLLIGGTSERALRIAAERADIVSFGGRLQVPGRPPGTLRFITAAETAERMAFFQAAAGTRAGEIELNSFIVVIEVTDDRRAAAERMFAAQEPFFLVDGVEQALESPFLLIGTEEEIARQLLDNRERYGFTYISVRRPHMELFGPIIKRVRSLA
jgi:probable F420-dependent oxidoreductase